MTGICHLEKKPFFAFGSQYEIQIASDGIDIEVRAFNDGEPVNGMRYTATLKQAFKVRATTGVDLVDQLVRLAKEHIEYPIGWN
jgi:hypothetical protein